jgi:hypothetical protein
MTRAFKPDQLVDDGERYVYQDGVWTNEAGMRVSLVRSQRMTMKFYEQHGRAPHTEPKAVPQPRPGTKAAKAKAATLRAAIAKAQGVDGGDDG